jgi:hypothetical protein
MIPGRSKGLYSSLISGSISAVEPLYRAGAARDFLPRGGSQNLGCKIIFNSYKYIYMVHHRAVGLCVETQSAPPLK